MSSDSDKLNELKKKAERESLEFDICVYGSQAQSKLAEFSKTLSDMILNSDCEEIETLLNSVVNKLNESVLRTGRFQIFSNENATKRYSAIIECIDDLALNLRLHQAKLLKNITVFERMEELIQECCDELGIYIEVAGERLEEGFNGCSTNKNLWPSTEDEWYSQFEKKLDELRMTHIVSMQSKAQIKLMRHNNLVLVEKLGRVLSNTIPLWRNQAILKYGLERYDEDSRIQKKIEVGTKEILKENNNSIRKTIHKIQKKSNKDDIDIEQIKELNQNLEKTLNDIIAIEQNTMNGELQMNKILFGMEKDNLEVSQM